MSNYKPGDLADFVAMLLIVRWIWKWFFAKKSLPINTQKEAQQSLISHIYQRITETPPSAK